MEWGLVQIVTKPSGGGLIVHIDLDHAAALLGFWEGQDRAVLLLLGVG